MKKFLLVFLLLFIPNFVHADSIRMSGPGADNINWDTSVLTYELGSYEGQDIIEVSADNFGYYRNGKYIDTSYMPKSFGAWKYYTATRNYMYCYTSYDNDLISIFKFDKVDEITYEYVPAKGWKGKPVLVATYRPVDNMEFRKYDADGNLVSIFSRKKNSLKYWYEYSPNGNLVTKHLTKTIPYQPVPYEH